MSKELIPLNNLNALEVFSKEGGLDPIINKIREQVKSEVFDVSTEEGRKHIGSVARKIGSAKATLEKMALNLTEDWRTKTSAVNAEKKRVKEELDALRDEIKAPLDEYKEKQRLRVERHETLLSGLENADLFEFPNPTTDLIAERINLIGDIYERDWEEFKARADIAYNESKQKLEALYEARVKSDEEQAELERLRKEKEERDRKDREDKLKREAAEQARKDAEEKAKLDAKKAADAAKAEKDRIQKEKDDADRKAKEAEDARIAAEKKAEADKKAAAKKAEDDKAAAIDAERKRVADEKKAAKDAEAKREANKKHRAKINNEVLEDLQESVDLKEGGCPFKQMITAIAHGKVRNVKIVY